MKPIFIMIVGLPASGKSTYAKELSEKYNANIHSSDVIREELSGDVNNQNINSKVFQTLHSRIKEDLRNGKNCIYDATNINYKRRMAFLQELNKIPCKKICILMATPYKECLKRNTERDRKVPEEVIEKMYRHFDVPYWYEGWTDIWVKYSPHSQDSFGYACHFVGNTKNYNQDNKHHKLSLGEHSELTWKYISEHCTDNDNNSIALRIASVLHDNGKPFTKTFKNSKGEITEQAHYYNHERVGSYNSLFYKMICSPLKVAMFIRWHMQLYFIKDNEKAHQKYKKLWGKDLYNDIILLHEADKNAH